MANNTVSISMAELAKLQAIAERVAKGELVESRANRPFSITRIEVGQALGTGRLADKLATEPMLSIDFGGNSWKPTHMSVRKAKLLLANVATLTAIVNK